MAIVPRGMHGALLAAAICTSAALGAAAGSDDPADALPALGIDIARTSVSGVSSGAYMAGQFHIAHSDMVIGAGLVAGGPFACAESEFSRMVPVWHTAVAHNAAQAVNGCMSDSLGVVGGSNPARLAARAEELAEAGAVAPLKGLTGDRVYLFWGEADDTVAETVVAAAGAFYRLAGVPEKQIAFVRGRGAGHGFITDRDGAPCGLSEAPFVNDCDYDQAGVILAHIYGALAPPASEPAGAFVTFDQRPFTQDLDSHGLAEQGVVYVPAACGSEAGCAVHVAFHGCRQNREAVGDAFVRGSGFARWAAGNRLVILFPQVAQTLFNPRSCWDWWGYTTLDYLSREAPQIQAVRRMLERLAR